MSSESAITAAETPAANGHGEAHSTATFKALMLGSIGVVYGDIGTSPLYALREAVVAATGEGGVTTMTSAQRIREITPSTASEVGWPPLLAATTASRKA